MKKYRVILNEEEREYLQSLISKRHEQSTIVKRAYVLLAADEGNSAGACDELIKHRYGLSLRSIERLRQRLVEEGLQVALVGKKREVFKEKIFDGAVEAHLLALRCSQAPAGYNRWTIRLLADKLVELEYVESISRETVRQLLKKTP